jgi:hypothetical protein
MSFVDIITFAIGAMTIPVIFLIVALKLSSQEKIECDRCQCGRKH